MFNNSVITRVLCPSRQLVYSWPSAAAIVTPAVLMKHELAPRPSLAFLTKPIHVVEGW